MKIIKDWFDKKLTCNKCGADKSVKYQSKDGKYYCNGCIIEVEKEG